MARILGGRWGVGGLKKGGNAPRAMDSQRCKSSTSRKSTRVVVLLCCRMYIPDLPTHLVFYLETTHGSSIDPLPTTTPTILKSFYIPERTISSVNGTILQILSLSDLVLH